MERKKGDEKGMLAVSMRLTFVSFHGCTQDRADIEFLMLRARILVEQERFFGPAQRQKHMVPFHHVLVRHGDTGLHGLGGVGADQWNGVLNALKTKIDTDVGALKTDVGALKTDVGALKTDVGALKTDVGALKTKIETMETKMDTMLELLRRQTASS